MTTPMPEATPAPPPQPVPAAFDAQLAAPVTAPAPQPAAAQPLPQIQAVESATVQIPEGGYAQRIVRVPLPGFRLPGVPEPWVEMRNPGMMAAAGLEEVGAGLAGVTVGPDGEPAGEADAQLVLATLVRLLRGWCMWDATSEEDVPPLLPEKVTVDLLRRAAPVGVIKAIGEAFMELQNPQ